MSEVATDLSTASPGSSRARISALLNAGVDRFCISFQAAFCWSWGTLGLMNMPQGAKRHARAAGQALRGLETGHACDGRARRGGELMAGEGGDPVVVHGHFALVEVVHAVDGREGADALGGVLGHQLLVERGPLERARGVEQ